MANRNYPPGYGPPSGPPAGRRHSSPPPQNWYPDGKGGGWYWSTRKNDWVHRKKQSGATEKEFVTKDGATGTVINAWFRNRKAGMVKIVAFENSKSVKSESRKGNRFITTMFEIFYKDSGNKILEIGTYNYNSGKVFLKKTGIIISTKAPNGGYAGYYRKNR